MWSRHSSCSRAHIFVADANMLGVEQPNDRGEDGLARKSVGASGPVRHGGAVAAASCRIRATLHILRCRASHGIGVVAILLAAPRIHAGGLKMAIGIGAEPGVFIGGGSPIAFRRSISSRSVMRFPSASK